MRLNFWQLLFGFALLGSVVLGLMQDKEWVYLWDFPLFFALTGLLGCLFLSWVAKGLVSPLLDRPEDFYDPSEKDPDWSGESPAVAPPASTPRGRTPAGREG